MSRMLPTLKSELWPFQRPLTRKRSMGAFCPRCQGEHDATDNVLLDVSTGGHAAVLLRRTRTTVPELRFRVRTKSAACCAAPCMDGTPHYSATARPSVCTTEFNKYDSCGEHMATSNQPGQQRTLTAICMALPDEPDSGHDLDVGRSFTQAGMVNVLNQVQRVSFSTSHLFKLCVSEGAGSTARQQK